MPVKELSRLEELADTGSAACEDCPDINADPPDKSECPYFDGSGAFPVCIREGGMDAQLRQFIGPVDLGKIPCQRFVDSSIESNGE